MSRHAPDCNCPAAQPATLTTHLDTLHDHARSFVCHWSSDDGADDIDQARAACRDVASARSALSKANDAAHAMLAALNDISAWLVCPDTSEENVEHFRQMAARAIAQAKAAGITP